MSHYQRQLRPQYVYRGEYSAELVFYMMEMISKEVDIYSKLKFSRVLLSYKRQKYHHQLFEDILSYCPKHNFDDALARVSSILNIYETDVIDLDDFIQSNSMIEVTDIKKKSSDKLLISYKLNSDRGLRFKFFSHLHELTRLQTQLKWRISIENHGKQLQDVGSWIVSMRK